MQPQADEQIRKPHRFRYLIDIVALVAATFGLDVAISAFVNVPVNLQIGFVLDAIGKLLLIAIASGLIWLRGERLADIGLKRPANWPRTITMAIVFVVLLFLAMYLSEHAGFRRDLTKFAALQGNLPATLLGVFYALIGAGLYEEFTFRGFIFQGFAMFFGGSRGAWMAACIVQAALFGAAHAYQNPLGMLITGTLGLLLGLVVLACGRNLWLVIIGHGLYDASRFVLFYFQGPPLG
jgi:membrane protease YdiL (CAAX protease family)